VNNQDTLQLLLRNAELILSDLKRAESAQNEVFASHTTELKVVFEGKDFSVSASNATAMYGIRSIVNGRLGFITTNSADEASLKSAAREVQLIAKLSTPSPHHQIAPKVESAGHFESLDTKLKEFTPRDVCDYAEKVVQEAHRDNRVTVDRAEFSWHKSSWVLGNSNGFTQSAAQAICSWYVMGMAKTEKEVTSFDYDGGSVPLRSEIDDELARTISSFRESVVCSLGAKKGRTYRGPVLFHPHAVMDLIAQFVAANCSGLRHQDGMSSWKGKLGQKVASEKLNVYEDPLDRKRAEGWSPFDREGIMTARHNLLQDGHLNFIAQNCFSAHREGTSPTGNATGGARGLPMLGFANLSVGSSRGSGPMITDEHMHQQLNKGLVIKRFSGNSDMSSGHFSGVAKNSYWVENGSRSHPVVEVMVSGNLFEVVEKILAIGSVQHKLIGGGLAPYILVDGLSVTSA
jgi:PmbA protein